MKKRSPYFSARDLFDTCYAQARARCIEVTGRDPGPLIKVAPEYNPTGNFWKKPEPGPSDTTRENEEEAWEDDEPQYEPNDKDAENELREWRWE